MKQYSYFPTQLPDAFLSIKNSNPPHRFFLDIIPENLPSKPLFQRITQYAEFFDEGGWADVSDQPPTLLFIAENGTTERRIRRIIQAALYKAEVDEDLTVLTSTASAIENIAGDGTIWTSLDDPDELLTLVDV